MSPTVEQRNKSLQLANNVRQLLTDARAELRQLSAAEARTRAAEMVQDENTYGALRVGSLLRSMPRIGPTSPVLQRVLRFVDVGDATRVRDLTPRQRDLLAYAVALPHAEQLRLQPPATRLAQELAEMRRRHDRAVAVLRVVRGPDARLAELVLRELGA